MLFTWVVLALVGCGGDVADQAKADADKVCACTTFDCTTAPMQDLNKISVTQSDAVGKLSADRKSVYDDAQKRAADCQDKLRPAP